jgi:hypothetical protein
MTFAEWYAKFWRGARPDELVATHLSEARRAWEIARADLDLPVANLTPEREGNTAEITEAEYYQRQRQKFWQKAYLVAYEAALSHPETVPPKFNRETENWAHNVAYMAAEEALFDADLSRKRGRLSYRYWF